jgi:hypothetical protein
LLTGYVEFHAVHRIDTLFYAEWIYLQNNF